MTIVHSKSLDKEINLEFSTGTSTILSGVKLQLKILGCLPIDTHLPNWCGCIPINFLHIVLINAILILNVVFTVRFYIRDVEKFTDLAECVFWCSRSVISLILYGIFVWHRTKLAKLLDDLDEIVNKSKTLLGLVELGSLTNDETFDFNDFFHSFSCLNRK